MTISTIFIVIIIMRTHSNGWVISIYTYIYYTRVYTYYTSTTTHYTLVVTSTQTISDLKTSWLAYYRLTCSTIVIIITIIFIIVSAACLLPRTVKDLCSSSVYGGKNNTSL